MTNSLSYEAHLRTKNKVFEPCKRVLTQETFLQVLEGRQFAVARSEAKAKLKDQLGFDSLGDGHLYRLTDHGARDSAMAPRLQGEVRKDGGGECAMEIDEQDGSGGPQGRLEATRHLEDLQDFAKRQEADGRQSQRERANEEREREARAQWEAAEQRRLQRLKEIERERAECQEGLNRSEEALKKLTLEIEPLKDEKAKLVAQLKQVLQAEDAAKARANLLMNLEEGEMLPSPVKPAPAFLAPMEL